MKKTEQENFISNLSYTAKDFSTVYPELLSEVTTLTTKWNPSTSNESDPGVVLLKELAVIADKLDYNIDKNVLENFPLSVTQFSNASQIYDMEGYRMSWYRSATTNLSIRFTGSISDFDKYKGSRQSIIIDRFTMFTNEDENIVFTLYNNAVSLSQRNLVPLPLPEIMEGAIYDYEINGEKLILLSNLDADLRLYFTEKQVAENGIFISNSDNINWDEWSQVDNLESSSLSQKIYEFGVEPNSNTCYIQFPQDIANLIGNGLYIKYIVSSGVDGNIKSGVITKFLSDFTVTLSDGSTEVVNDFISIVNTNSALNGNDPESLDEAYFNYKKIKNTFNTIITCKDYESAIYRLPDEDLACNSVVSDRTNDVNYTTSVIEFTTSGEELQNYVTTNTETLVSTSTVLNGIRITVPVGNSCIVSVPTMTAYDLGMYALRPMSNIYNAETYNNSFLPTLEPRELKNVFVDEGGMLYGYKAIQHDFIDTNISNNIYACKILYKLNGKILTYYKVSATEASEIEENIKNSLYLNYNSEEVNFGDEITYEEIVETIKNADDRIKTVVLDDIDKELNIMNGEGDIIASPEIGFDDTSVYGDNTPIDVGIISKLVLNGTIQLFDFDTDFNFEYGQTDPLTFKDIHYITTELKANLSKSNDYSYYDIKANEGVYLFAPNLVTATTYSTYVKYKCTITSVSEIPSDTNYALKDGESITFDYTDANNTHRNVRYEKGTIICPNFELRSTDTLTSLSSNNKVDIKTVNKVVLSDSIIRCYWIRNNKNNVLFKENEFEIILENNEYFIYPSENGSELVVLGSGTQISRSNTSVNEISMSQTITVEEIVSNGYNAFNELTWYNWTNFSGETLTITALQIIAVGEGYTVKFKTASTNTTLTNAPIEVSDISYFPLSKESTDTIKVGDLDITEYSWKAKSTLSIQTSNNIPQTLGANQYISFFNEEQNLLIEEGSDNNYSLGPSDSFLSNYPIYLSGGNMLDASVLSESGISYDLKIYKFTDNTDVVRNYISAKTISIEADDYISFKASAAKSITLPVGLPSVEEPSDGEIYLLDSYKYIIPVIKDGNDYTVTITANEENTRITNFKIFGTNQDAAIKNSGAYLICIGETDPSIKYVSITMTWSGGQGTDKIDTIHFGKIHKLNGFNAAIEEYNYETTESTKTIVKNPIFDFIRNNYPNFSFLHTVDELEQLSVSDPLSPDAFLDHHNIYNKFTICQLDTNNLNVKVSKSSRSN